MRIANVFRWIVIALLVAPLGAVAGQNRIGAGVHYWTTVDNIDSDYFDNSGLGWIVSYQRKGGEWTKLVLDVEILPDGYGGSSNTVYSPQVLVTVGSGVYAGAGIGIDYLNDEFAEDPFYILRLGIELPILPTLFLDVNANYRFMEFQDIDALDTDVVTLAALLRLEF
jgi:hypothetical protein